MSPRQFVCNAKPAKPILQRDQPLPMTVLLAIVASTLPLMALPNAAVVALGNTLMLPAHTPTANLANPGHIKTQQAN